MLGTGPCVTILLTNHAPPLHPIKTELVRVTLTEADAPLTAYIERIDDAHANAKRAWREMGQPEYLSPAQRQQLQAVSQPRKEPIQVEYQDQEIRLAIDLMPHAVVAVTIELASPATEPTPRRVGVHEQ